MKIKELREKSDAELQKLLKSTREHLREVRFKVASEQLKNVREIRVDRKTVAKILTVEKERSNKKPVNKK
ncbi:MAG: 50S ribosomal protein L29 [Candidatus Kerfeldbacteria bacterium CG_4_10_14_0_8_um_filter_42_10]|uniref:Large ribosomal subunit protein uL29 n=1 Tax=Candidatus Kerfeldbacteria bacterium CG_4_10_14_0_8_um_filter_42_10 TaxID=2014248 RepID=A0A2M7RIG8_9BACT|nr:MAG: 50S ribosomal protein L29 [Candidatus Kerfeldbacteria bacterium CG_4_10_14_0_8_um_filter_42_10]